ncbi:MAG: hypothetical protein WAW17_27795, partial [Rhodococcus sp. (in: high G+C Gram-positive bacteria)]|uniref:hypothetical protein n=1 Tax=Rhodococcus sp. TaxID=1831 RepID=UPI003BAE2E91
MVARSVRVAEALAIGLLGIAAVSCGGVIAGSPQVVAAGQPVYGQPVSELDRAELAVAARARAIAACGVLDRNVAATFGELTAYGPVGDLSTCHAELIPPGGAPAAPAWVEVVVGEHLPPERTGVARAEGGVEVRPALDALPGTCTLYFALPSDAERAPARWGHVSYLDGSGGVGDSGGGDDCAEAWTVVRSAATRLNSAPPDSAKIPLMQQDPCRTVERLRERGVESFAPGSRPFECLITLRGGQEAAVRFGLSPEPPQTGGAEEVMLGGNAFRHFQDARECHYYFYPGDVLDANLPSSPVNEREKYGNRVTASVEASAPDCDDARTLVLTSSE